MRCYCPLLAASQMVQADVKETADQAGRTALPLLALTPGNTLDWLVAPNGVVKWATPRRASQRAKKEQVAQRGLEEQR